MTVYRRHNAAAKQRRAVLAAEAREYNAKFELAAVRDSSRVTQPNQEAQMDKPEDIARGKTPEVNVEAAKQNDPRVRSEERAQRKAAAGNEVSGDGSGEALPPIEKPEHDKKHAKK